MHLISANIFFFYRENICPPNIGMHSLYYSLYHIYLFKVKSNGWMQKKFQKSWNFGRGVCGGASLDMLHSSEIRALCPTKYSREIIQKLCSFFNSSNFSFSLWMLWSGKMKNKLVYTWNIVNFVAFHWNVWLSTNLLFLKSDMPWLYVIRRRWWLWRIWTIANFF